MIFYMSVTFSSLFGHNLVKSAQKKKKTLFDLRYSNGSFTSPVSQVYISRIIYEKVNFGGYLLYAQLP